MWILQEFPSHPSHYLASPPYKPKLKAQTTLIIFTVTRDRLEEQLLAEEQFPDLENHKVKNVFWSFYCSWDFNMPVCNCCTVITSSPHIKEILRVGYCKL